MQKKNKPNPVKERKEYGLQSNVSPTGKVEEQNPARDSLAPKMRQ